MDHLHPLSAFCKFQKLNVKGSRVMLLFLHGQRDEGTLTTIVDVIVKLHTCEAHIAAEHSDSLLCAYINRLDSSCPAADSDSLTARALACARSWCGVPGAERLARSAPPDMSHGL